MGCNVVAYSDSQFQYACSIMDDFIKGNLSSTHSTTIKEMGKGRVFIFLLGVLKYRDQCLHRQVTIEPKLSLKWYG